MINPIINANNAIILAKTVMVLLIQIVFYVKIISYKLANVYLNVKMENVKLKKIIILYLKLNLIKK